MLAPDTNTWELELRARLAAADQTALAELYDQYSSFVYGLARRVTGDGRGGEEVTQDVFSYVWERPDRFDPERGSMRSWLGVITHRRAVDWVRREAASRRGVERLGTMARSVPDVEEMATALVTAERIRMAVASLPEEQRRAINLAYFGGRTYRQVAAEEGIPEGTAKSRLRLGLRRIAQMMETTEREQQS